MSKQITGPLISLGRSVLVVDNLVAVGANISSDLELEKGMFKQSNDLPKTQIRKEKMMGFKDGLT